MRKVRENIFETNSSSTHVLVLKKSPLTCEEYFEDRPKYGDSDFDSSIYEINLHKFHSREWINTIETFLKKEEFAGLYQLVYKIPREKIGDRVAFALTLMGVRNLLVYKKVPFVLDKNGVQENIYMGNAHPFLRGYFDLLEEKIGINSSRAFQSLIVNVESGDIDIPSAILDQMSFYDFMTWGHCYDCDAVAIHEKDEDREEIPCAFDFINNPDDWNFLMSDSCPFEQFVDFYDDSVYERIVESYSNDKNYKVFI